MQELMLFDGAFGTYYNKLFDDQNACELANVEYPFRVVQIHQEYIKAGAMAIKTNTFGINEMNFNERQCFSLIQAGYQLACYAQKHSNKDLKIFCDLGPMVASRNHSIVKQYQKLVDCFIQAGGKYFLFETLSSDEGIYDICKYIKEQVEDSFIIVSYGISADGYSKQGISLTKLIENYRHNPYQDVIGLNCVCGPRHMANLLKYFDLKKDQVCVMPNAGYPSVLKNKSHYHHNEDYYGEIVLEMIKKGVRFVGGCCGSEPSYIQKIHELLLKQPKIVIEDVDDRLITNKKNNDHVLLTKLQNKQKVIAVEFDPPNHCDISKFMEDAIYLQNSGLDAITIADCPIARVRVDSSLLACKLHRELNLNVIPHMTCRDRNINATKALLYGLAIEGVDNVLVVTGDPIASEDKDLVKGVFNFNSQILAGYIQDLNETLFPKPFLIFGALNINAINFDAELVKAKNKLKQGVKAFLTQPVHSKQAIENLKKAKEQLDAYILGGIMPIVSYRNAMFMHHEINGMKLDQILIDLYKDKTKEEANELAYITSCKTIDEIKDYVDGYYLITPFHRVELIAKIIQYIKK